jgi:hypothetical protein
MMHGQKNIKLLNFLFVWRLNNRNLIIKPERRDDYTNTLLLGNYTEKNQGKEKRYGRF